ncbi:MAG: hypothetical protein CVU08_04930 [Bacteroidetes bacterium HGW-Bacteroidetes-3]|jgi:hypothetical protein|nr:MAG: hypothetical protein CVU08_04930 [Bacteroidetes bacterium HGW-Bacteroidetes-3]
MSLLKSNYIILKEQNLIVEYHSGILDTDSFINFKKSITLDPLFLPSLNYFVHLKKVTFSTTAEDINKYVTFLNTNSKVYGNRRVALITNTPNQVVSTTIFKMIQQNTSQVEIFSTNESALEWLNSKLDKNEILSVLAKLMLV